MIGDSSPAPLLCPFFFQWALLFELMGRAHVPFAEQLERLASTFLPPPLLLQMRRTHITVLSTRSINNHKHIFVSTTSLSPPLGLDSTKHCVRI